MKIVLVQDRLRSGGTERQSLLLAGGFASAGHEPLLLTFRPGGALAPQSPPGLTRASLQPFDFGWDWFAPGLVRQLRRERPDIVLCMGRMANCYAGRLQAKLPSAAVVATLRTGKTLPRLFLSSLRRASHVVANSRETLDRWIGPAGIRPEACSVILNGLIFPPRSAETRAAARAGLGLGPETTVLLDVAMFRPEKNQRELIEIAAELPAGLDWRLWLPGLGPERAGCERRARALGLEQRVWFPGFVADPSSLYAAADIAAHASKSESLSNFLIEAQSRGLPAVAYAALGARECFLPGRTGWEIPRGDRAAFRARLEALAREPAEARRSRAEEASAHARSAFDPARQIAAYLELFARLKKTRG